MGLTAYVQHQNVVQLKLEHIVSLETAKEGTKIATRALQIQHDEIVRSKDEKIRNIDVALSNALDRVRNRPERPEAGATAPEAGSACTGAELFREDGEFLTREAARADKILEERNFYYNSYERARKQLEALQNGN